MAKALPTKNDNHRETAAQAYQRNMKGIHEKLNQISKYLNDKTTDSNNVNWGHVGSAAHLNELLDEMCEFIGAGK